MYIAYEVRSTDPYVLRQSTNHGVLRRVDTLEEAEREAARWQHRDVEIVQVDA